MYRATSTCPNPLIKQRTYYHKLRRTSPTMRSSDTSPRAMVSNLSCSQACSKPLCCLWRKWCVRASFPNSQIKSIAMMKRKSVSTRQVATDATLSSSSTILTFARCCARSRTSVLRSAPLTQIVENHRRESSPAKLRNTLACYAYYREACACAVIMSAFLGCKSSAMASTRVYVGCAGADPPMPRRIPSMLCIDLLTLCCFCSG